MEYSVSPISFSKFYPFLMSKLSLTSSEKPALHIHTNTTLNFHHFELLAHLPLLFLLALAFDHQFKKLANLFCIGSDTKFLRFCGPYCLCYCSPGAPETICKWIGIVLCTDKTLFIEQVRPRDYNLTFLINSLALLLKVFICALFITLLLYCSIRSSKPQRQDSLLDVRNALFPTSLSLAPGSVHIC